MSHLHEDVLRAWGVEWHSRNHLDGERRNLQWRPNGEQEFVLFRTRREARAYIEKHYGYIRDRPDLQREPHGWFMPQAIRVEVRPTPSSKSGGSGGEAR